MSSPSAVPIKIGSFFQNQQKHTRKHPKIVKNAPKGPLIKDRGFEALAAHPVQTKSE